MAGENGTTFRDLSIKTVIEWKIKDFLNLRPGNGEKVMSPIFCVSNASWQIRLYPLGLTSRFKDCLSLYLSQLTGKDPILLSCKFSIKVNDSVINTGTFENSSKGKCFWGLHGFLTRSILLKYFTPASSKDIVIIVCSVQVLDNAKNENFSTQSHSLDNSIKNLTKNFEDMFLSHKLSDVKIKVGPKEFPAHKAILAARSPVFSSMFEHEMSENLNGVIHITDCDTDSFELFLRFLYTGNVDKTTNRNILGLYKIADKYFMKDLKEICCGFMSESLQIDFICDVLELAITHEETDLLKAAIEFFTVNATDIFVTKKWQTFNLEKTSMANEIVSQMSINACISLKK